MESLKALRQISWRQAAHQVLNVLVVLSSALMIWKGMTLLTNSESPIVVVLSGSMEPAFYRGDLLFLSLPETPIELGEICVFKLAGKDIPVVHRVIRAHNVAAGRNDTDVAPRQYLLTKGDNNPIDDRGFGQYGVYNRGQQWIHERDIVGRVRGYLPYVGMITILMNDYPLAKYCLLGALMLFVLFNKD